MADFSLEFRENEWLEILALLRKEIRLIREGEMQRTGNRGWGSGGKMMHVFGMIDMANAIEQQRFESWSEESKQMMFEHGALPTMMLKL